MLNKFFFCATLFALFVGTWEAVSYAYESLRFVLPAPSIILTTLWQHADRFYWHSMSTMQEMAGGFLLAFVAAFPLAWLMATFGPLRSALQPFFVVIQCVPVFALAPLMVLWFGWSYIAVAVPTALMIFFPLTITIYRGLCATPRQLLDFFYLHQATAWQTFYKLQLPYALPQVFAGFRIAVAMACLGAVAGEWAGAQKGLGVLMLESRRVADIEMMFAALACVMGISLFFYALTAYLEKQMGRRYYRGHIGKNPLLSCLLLLFLISATGCQPSPADKKETRLVLDWLPNPNHVVLYAGVKKGFFEKQGINLKIFKMPDSNDGIPFLTSGQAEVCLSYMPHTLEVLSRGGNVKPIGILIQEPLNTFIFRKGEGIQRPEDLDGKILGYCVTGFETKVLSHILSSRSIVPKKAFNVSFDLVSALATKRIDFVYGAYWNIEVENLRSKGLDVGYFFLKEFDVPNYYELIFLIRKDSLQESDIFVKGFQTAVQESIDYALQYPDEAFEIYIQANPDKSLKTQKWERQAWYQTLPVLAQQQQIDPEVWNNFLRWFVARGVIPPDKEPALHFSKDEGKERVLKRL